MMKVIIGCEESQAVTIAFRNNGIEAYSCDLKQCSGGHPEWHIKGDIFEVIKGGAIGTENGDTIYIDKWNAGIFFPDCTYLTISANTWYADQPPRKSGALVGVDRRMARINAMEFFIRLYNSLDIVAIENTIGVMSSMFRKPDQVVQPWMFGHGETKATCLWLKNLPLLEPTDIVGGREQRIFKLSPTKDRSALRSKTYQGIAEAMANQWTETIKINSYEKIHL